jgi:hypothetical protein
MSDNQNEAADRDLKIRQGLVAECFEYAAKQVRDGEIDPHTAAERLMQYVSMTLPRLN